MAAADRRRVLLAGALLGCSDDATPRQSLATRRPDATGVADGTVDGDAGRRRAETAWTAWSWLLTGRAGARRRRPVRGRGAAGGRGEDPTRSPTSSRAPAGPTTTPSRLTTPPRSSSSTTSPTLIAAYERRSRRRADARPRGDRRGAGASAVGRRRTPHFEQGRSTPSRTSLDADLERRDGGRAGRRHGAGRDRLDRRPSAPRSAPPPSGVADVDALRRQRADPGRSWPLPPRRGVHPDPVTLLPASLLRRPASAAGDQRERPGVRDWQRIATVPGARPGPGVRLPRPASRLRAHSHPS